MATEYISIDYEGEDKIHLMIDLIDVKAKKYLLDLLDDAGDIAKYWLRMYVPVESGYTWEHVEKSGPKWNPGGLGGGGDYKVIVGIRRGISKHPLYAALGTGIYASTPASGFYGPGRSLIRPRSKKHMTFFGSKPPGWKKVKTIRGQRPQRFMYVTFQQARLYLNAHTLRFGEEMKMTFPSASSNRFTFG